MDNTTGQIPSPYFLLELVPINNGEEMPPSPVSCELLLFIYALWREKVTIRTLQKKQRKATTTKIIF